MRVLITAGPTRELIDPVRFISNRSSGRMGLALINAALLSGHTVTAIVGPVVYSLPASAHRINVQTTREMHDAVLGELPRHDVLLMVAAVADYRPLHVSQTKLGRSGRMTIELEPTEDIIAAAVQARKPGQRIVGFSLEQPGDIARAKSKLKRKGIDMIVFNPLDTMNSDQIEAALLWSDGQEEPLELMTKEAFARVLIERATQEKWV